MSRLAPALGLLFVIVQTVDAQWLNHRDAKTPRTADGKPNLSAPAPRVDGRPDLSGVWRSERTPADEFVRALGPAFTQLQVDFNDINKYVLNVFWGTKIEEEPIKPEGAAILKQRLSGSEQFQGASCLPASLPASMNILAFKMIQAPRQLVVLPGNGDPARQIYTDGRSLPKDPEPSWMGSSVGHWQGETLVVDTIGFKENAWLDGFGHPRSEAMHITERYHRRDFGHMDLEMILEDPKMYTRPWSIFVNLVFQADTELIEFICEENEKDVVHLVGK